jgi:hypothetical protein
LCYGNVTGDEERACAGRVGVDHCRYDCEPGEIINTRNDLTGREKENNPIKKMAC